ncbi:MAG: hypothetical protein BroJett003_06000 [Planctomycetota bacterium]|nr:MAG: hypothetical protein BroJett003_06000 [Planctomycetota bacterium]
MPSYLPASDADFDAWRVNFLAYANTHRPQLGLTLGDLIGVNTLASIWDGQYAAHNAAKNAAQAATQNKDAARAGLEAAIRALVQRLQAASDVDDAERAALLITVPDRAPSPLPTARPPSPCRPRARWCASTPASACSTASPSPTKPSPPARANRRACPPWKSDVASPGITSVILVRRPKRSVETGATCDNPPVLGSAEHR